MSEIQNHGDTPGAATNDAARMTNPSEQDPKDTVAAILELSRLLGAIYASKVIAANDNCPPLKP